MFYVASIIPFRVFLELLWKSTLLLRYKLNILWPRWLNHFDIMALLIGGYARFIPLDKIVLYVSWKPDLWQFINVTVRFDIVFVF